MKDQPLVCEGTEPHSVKEENLTLRLERVFWQEKGRHDRHLCSLSPTPPGLGVGWGEEMLLS